MKKMSDNTSVYLRFSRHLASSQRSERLLGKVPNHLLWPMLDHGWGQMGNLLLCTLIAGFIKIITESLFLASRGYVVNVMSEVEMPGGGGVLPDEISGINFAEESDGREILVPRILHQTYKSHDLPPYMQAMVDSWRETNVGWEVRLYNDTECLELVRTKFPEYLESYLALKKKVEQADFFRYLVVLHYGGAYADMDTECKRPLDKVVRSKDKMVVGWENEFSSDLMATKRTYARTRQILQWFFAAVPGHPALKEVCDLVAKNAWKNLSSLTDHSTLERTGPGVFTDVVLRHALIPEEGVRVLPRVAFGANGLGDGGLHRDSPGITVLHHYHGSWKIPQKKKRKRWFSHHSVRKTEQVVPPKNTDGPSSTDRVYPVGIPWEPSFVVMVHLKGHGELVGTMDVSAELTTWGNWHAGMHPSNTPPAVDVLLGLLKEGTGLIDLGAGLGFFTIAAASRGHPVVAFDSSRQNLAALEQSIEYNGFNDSIWVIHGVSRGQDCQGKVGEKPLHTHLKEIGSWEMWKGNSPHGPKVSQSTSPAEIFRRGILKGMSAGGIRIGASAGSQISLIIRAAMDFIVRERPKVIMIEFMPFMMIACTPEDPTEVLLLLYEIGYKQVYHAGELCRNVQSHSTRHVGPFLNHIEEPPDLQTWCNIQPGHFHWLVDNALLEWPENLIFILG